MNEGIKMQISAFVDGELPENEAELLLRRLSQDIGLRQQAAEYLALGRAMRGQNSIAALGDLRGRIAAAIDDRSLDADIDAAVSASRRYARPLAGFAIAASVALAAIFGLQMSLDSTVQGDLENRTADGDKSYTVPDLDYFQRHNEFSSATGNNNFNVRRVTVRMLEDGTLETDFEEIEPPVEATSGEAADAVPERQSP